jgi:hypothetical protein
MTGFTLYRRIAKQVLRHVSLRAIKEALAIVVLSTLATHAWAVNRCTNAGGEVVFQDLPCAGKGEVLKMSLGSGHTAEMPSDTAPAGWRKTVNLSILRNEPLVGMTRKELDASMGSPSKVNPGNYSGSLQDQIIYTQTKQTWYVYTEAGIVKSIQLVPGANVAAESGASKAVRCLSNHEIRGMETSASSITIGDAERAERWKQIGDARKCGK